MSERPDEWVGYRLKIVRRQGSRLSPTAFEWSLYTPDGNAPIYSWYGTFLWAIRRAARRRMEMHLSPHHPDVLWETLTLKERATEGDNE